MVIILDWISTMQLWIGIHQQFTSVPQCKDQSFELKPIQCQWTNILTKYRLVLPVCSRNLPLSLHKPHQHAFYKVNKHLYTDSCSYVTVQSLSAYMRRQRANKSSWNHSETNQDLLSESYWITEVNNEYKMYGQEDIWCNFPCCAACSACSYNGSCFSRGSVNTTYRCALAVKN